MKSLCRAKLEKAIADGVSKSLAAREDATRAADKHIADVQSLLEKHNSKNTNVADLYYVAHLLPDDPRLREVRPDCVERLHAMLDTVTRDRCSASAKLLVASKECAAYGWFRVGDDGLEAAAGAAITLDSGRRLNARTAAYEISRYERVCLPEHTGPSRGGREPGRC